MFRLLVTCACLVLGACQRVPLPQEAYVWQRQWTPALIDAVHEGESTFIAYRVFATESDRSGALIAITPNLDALTKLPATAVLRLNGNDPPPDTQALAARVREIVRTWRDAGVPLAGIEIDHDCATARLADYARLLAALRAHMQQDLRLSITALPAWIGAASLRDVLANVDESVLQVHAVQQPSAGLFDPRVARRWIDGYAAISSKPFRVALPAYGVRASFDERGRVLSVAAEMPRDDASDDARELAARPAEVAALLRELERRRPAQLAGIVWFRLPSRDDHRAWSFATLRAVIAGTPLHAQFEVRLETAAAGARDVVLANRGTLDARPPRIDVAARDCLAADGANGFAARLDERGVRYAPPDAILRAGRERRAGWLHCGIVEKATIDEAE